MTESLSTHSNYSQYMARYQFYEIKSLVPKMMEGTNPMREKFISMMIGGEPTGLLTFTISHV